MGSLVLMEQGTTLGIEGEEFAIRRGVHTIRRVRIEGTDQVLLMGKVEITSKAVAVLLHRGIDTAFLTLAGRYRGRLIGAMSKNIELRMAQFRAMADPGFCLSLSRAIVQGKILNQRNILLRAQRQLVNESLGDALGQMRQLVSRSATEENLDSLRGLEGQAAALYFGHFSLCLKNPQFTFTKRTRRPPRDPVNAMLSFGYTMLGIVAESIAYKVGLDPMMGAFHQPAFGRPSLMLDLIEEFRPVVVDSVVLRLINRKALRPEDFGTPPADFTDEVMAGADFDPEGEGANGPPGVKPVPVLLGEVGRRIFLKELFHRYNETMYYEPRDGAYALQDILSEQAYQVARVIRGEQESYRAFIPK